MQEGWVDVVPGDMRLFISIQDEWLALVQPVNWVVVQWERLDAQHEQFKRAERKNGEAPLPFIGDKRMIIEGSMGKALWAQTHLRARATTHMFEGTVESG